MWSLKIENTYADGLLAAPTHRYIGAHKSYGKGRRERGKEGEVIILSYFFFFFFFFFFCSEQNGQYYLCVFELFLCSKVLSLHFLCFSSFLLIFCFFVFVFFSRDVYLRNDGFHDKPYFPDYHNLDFCLRLKSWWDPLVSEEEEKEVVSEKEEKEEIKTEEEEREWGVVVLPIHVVAKLGFFLFFFSSLPSSSHSLPLLRSSFYYCLS